MRKFFISIVAVSVGLIGYVCYELQTTKSELLSPAALANIDALTDFEGETGNNEDIALREGCIHSGGNWDMASILASCGFETVECKVDGEISFLGITLKGSYYKKGSSYSMPWASYRCESSAGNCCTKQGLYSGENKLA